MSNEFNLIATARNDLGKGASRRLRRLAKEVPAIVYGGKKKPQSIAIEHRVLAKATENEAFFSHIITLEIDGKAEQVVIKDLQRHPSKPIIMHADFQRVSAKQTIHVKVPLHFINESKCKGVKLGGGSILHTITELEIICLPKDLPEFLEVDVADLDVGESIHISAIDFPKGVSSVDLTHGEDADHAVVTVKAPRGGADEAEEAEGEDAAESGDE